VFAPVLFVANRERRRRLLQIALRVGGQQNGALLAARTQGTLAAREIILAACLFRPAGQWEAQKEETEGGLSGTPGGLE